MRCLPLTRIDTSFEATLDQQGQKSGKTNLYAFRILNIVYSYVAGVVLPRGFTLPVGFTPQPLEGKYDEELSDFFEGYQFRHDIIRRIDAEVAIACREISMGRNVASGLRRLVCYALWGNPVDAYKWFEYVTSWLMIYPNEC